VLLGPEIVRNRRGSRIRYRSAPRGPWQPEPAGVRVSHVLPPDLPWRDRRSFPLCHGETDGHFPRPAGMGWLPRIRSLGAARVGGGDLLEEGAELLAALALGAGLGHPSGGHLQGGEQRGGAGLDVVEAGRLRVIDVPRPPARWSTVARPRHSSWRTSPTTMRRGGIRSASLTSRRSGISPAPSRLG
jgi:hypothetical protein